MAPSEKIRIAGPDKSAKPPAFSALQTVCESTTNGRGFTLIEVLVSMAIVGVLAVIATSGFTSFKDNARTARAIEEIRNLEKDISAYAIEKGSYPPGLVDIGKEGALDPWGHAYVYKRYVATEMRYYGAELNIDPPDYDLYSLGKDNATALDLNDPTSDDDILRIGNGAYVGTAKQFIN